MRRWLERLLLNLLNRVSGNEYYYCPRSFMSFNSYQAEMHRTYHHGRIDGHALGVAGEAGEICDMIKKAHYHKVPYSLDDMKKELGDLLWYLTAVASDHGFKLSDVAAANVTKLRTRYPKGFVAGGGVR